MARSFREAEEASNAQGTVQASLDWAMQNAKANPTPENIAIMKDTAAARQATVAANDSGKLVPTVTIGGAPAGYMPKVLADAQASAAQVSSTLSEVDKAIADVNTAGTEAGAIAEKMGGTPWTPISGGSGSTTDKPKTSVDEDAFGRLMGILNQWNLGSLSTVIRQLLTEGLSYDSVLTKIKYDSGKNPATGEAYNAAYTLRFAGNKARLDRGLNALTEEQYLSNENSYAETLKAYGLTNMLSLDRTTNEAKFAQYIANDLAPTEFRDRIDLAATRVINMDPAIKKNFMEYYPEVNKSDLISYFLAPDETLPLLKTKINAAEIGAAAGYQGLGIGVGRAEELAKFGETYDQAKTDYSKVAEVLPTGQKLSNIYGEEGIAYTQATAEDEFIKQDAAAKLKRNRLASKERAMFEGSNNISLDRSYQGKF